MGGGKGGGNLHPSTSAGKSQTNGRTTVCLYFRQTKNDSFKRVIKIDPVLV